MPVREWKQVLWAEGEVELQCNSNKTHKRSHRELRSWAALQIVLTWSSFAATDANANKIRATADEGGVICAENCFVFFMGQYFSINIYLLKQTPVVVDPNVLRVFTQIEMDLSDLWKQNLNVRRYFQIHIKKFFQKHYPKCIGGKYPRSILSKESE